MELRTATHRILLQDLDATSKSENGVWRYNTLGHYKVENKAILALLPRHTTNSSYNLSLISDKSDKSSLNLHNSPILSRLPYGNMNGTTNGSFSHTSHHHKDPNSASTLRVYHLVRPAADHGPQDNQVRKCFYN